MTIYKLKSFQLQNKHNIKLSSVNGTNRIFTWKLFLLSRRVINFLRVN